MDSAWPSIQHRVFFTKIVLGDLVSVGNSLDIKQRTQTGEGNGYHLAKLQGIS